MKKLSGPYRVFLTVSSSSSSRQTTAYEPSVEEDVKICVRGKNFYKL